MPIDHSTTIKKVFLLLFLLIPFIPPLASGQEIDATVHVDRSQINNTSLDYLNNLADEIQKYINNYTWTNDYFQPRERIHADIQITLLSVTNNNHFKASIVIRSLRPIYDSNRRTTIFLYHDKNWGFNYTPHRDLVHDKLQFDSITTLLDFYAYIILGYDYDTFSSLGGTSYFAEAQNLVSLAQTSSSTGWQRSSNDRHNRAELVSELLNPNYEPLRRAMYVYHRKGLDLFLKNPEKARKDILKALGMIQKAMRQTSRNLLFNIFFNTKAAEMVATFRDAPTDIRVKAYNILSDLDPTHLSAYSELQ
jgi:hypothetical protein